MECNANKSGQVQNIHIHCCNNIDDGTLKLYKGRLNVKYGINGTGKSTIAKAIELALQNNGENLKQLTPFKYQNSTGESNFPKVDGLNDFSSIAIFDERYLEQYVYMPDELLKNSFEVFVKGPDYDQYVIEIEQLISEIADTFKNDPELNTIIQAFDEFISGFGKANSGYSAAGAIGKGFGKGNKIANIPESLTAYAPYLRNIENGTNIKWLKWQQDGKTYLDMAEQCPYCTASVTTTRETIMKVSEEYNPKNVEHLNKMLNVFQQLAPYFSSSTNSKITELANNITGLGKEHQQYLVEIKGQVEALREKLIIIKSLNPSTLRDIEQIAKEIKTYQIDFSVFSHLQSSETESKVQKINASLESVLSKAGQLQGKVNQQKLLIKKTIETYSTEINDFLHYAGYKYAVSIEESNDKTYKLILKHKDNAETVQSAKTHLSFGERNAFALVLFMYGTLKEDCDLIVLDDPISSFDGNKQFAILNMLFMGKRCFKEKTVIVLTHEFNFVIDSIYNMAHKIHPSPRAAFLQTSGEGILTEIGIEKRDIISVVDVALNNISSSGHILCKLVYLRRLLEIQNTKNMAWQLLSNAFKKRDVPEYHSNDENRPMTEDEKAIGTADVQIYIPEFDYDSVIQLTKNEDELRTIYSDCANNYEKLQIYRIIKNENSSNDVIKKFVNETFHVENDYIFQLNPCVYVTVPQYIIDECNKDIMA